jgi:hypothetical protein
LSVEAAAAAIVQLINSRARSPRQAELVAILRRVGKPPPSSQADTDTAPAGADGYPDFGPVLGSDGHPLSAAHMTDELFVGHLLPTVRIACHMAGKSKAQLTEIVRNMIAEDFEMVHALLADCQHVVDKFQAIAEVVSAVWARIVAVGEVVEDERIACEAAQRAKP